MNEWWLLLICFLIVLLLALSVALYPLRKSRAVLFLAPVLIVLVCLAYWHWGAGLEWMKHLRANEKQQRIKTMLKSIHDPAELIEMLKATLHKHPNSARGWYLLGRLYVSQNQWQQANDAFVQAHELKPNDEHITVNYAQNLWQLNHQAFDKAIRTLLDRVLQQNPNQPDALAMLAMDAYKRHAFQQAIDYWQRLLKQVSPQSEEAQAIRKAIAQANMEIKSKQ